jgi:hypothetical protein
MKINIAALQQFAPEYKEYIQPIWVDIEAVMEQHPKHDTKFESIIRALLMAGF